jgi:hypothetical protein
MMASRFIKRQCLRRVGKLLDGRAQRHHLRRHLDLQNRVELAELALAILFHLQFVLQREVGLWRARAVARDFTQQVVGLLSRPGIVLAAQ